MEAQIKPGTEHIFDSKFIFAIYTIDHTTRPNALSLFVVGIKTNQWKYGLHYDVEVGTGCTPFKGHWPEDGIFPIPTEWSGANDLCLWL